MYSKSTPDILNVKVQDIFPGGFYFFHYQDSSYWMKWAPVFVADYKKFSNKIIIFALNFNMIPLEVRVLIFDKYITETATASDNFILPLKKNRFIKTDRYYWTSANPEKTKTTNFQGLYRAIKLRFAPKKKNNVFELGLQLDKKIAIAAARQIPIDSTHLVISQNLLPL